MPSRNRVKQWSADHVYHVYNRGNNKQVIFREPSDYAVFLNLLKRSLQRQKTADNLGRPYKNWHGELELLAFCLMSNHFHLLFYQASDLGISQFMSSITTSYVGYFNKKYSHTGRLFQDTFKASLVDEEVYWQHISRYIHLNARNWREWQWSSLPYFLGSKHADWVRPERVLTSFEGDDYLAFVADFQDVRAIQDELQYLVAG